MCDLVWTTNTILVYNFWNILFLFPDNLFYNFSFHSLWEKEALSPQNNHWIKLDVCIFSFLQTCFILWVPLGWAAAGHPSARAVSCQKVTWSLLLTASPASHNLHLCLHRYIHRVCAHTCFSLIQQKKTNRTSVFCMVRKQAYRICVWTMLY